MIEQWQLQPRDEAFHLERVAVAPPQPGSHEVVVRVRATSLNYRDLLTLRGATGQRNLAGVVPLSDGAGEVIATGDAVTRVRVGDRVAANFFRDWIEGPFDLRYHGASLGGSAPGMLAEQVVLPEHALVRIPDFLSFEEAATLPCAAVTAWQALFTRGTLRAGETVLVQGTGGVSIFGLQLAKAAGARVVLTSSSEAKLARAREMGADVLINYRENPDWEQAVLAATNGRGVDHVLEVGGPGTLEKSLASTAAGGHIALIGVLTGFGAPSGSLFPLVLRNADLAGIYVGSVADFEALLAFMNAHQIRPIIDRAFPFAEAAAAFDHLASGAHFGKIVVTV